MTVFELREWIEQSIPVWWLLIPVVMALGINAWMVLK